MRAWIKPALGVAIGAALLWIAMAQVDSGAVSTALLGANPRYLAISLGLYWCDIFLRIVRWRGLLAPTKTLRFGQVGQALIVGYAVNNLLPARLGEIFRADFLRRQFDFSRSAAVGSIIVERTLDGSAVVGLFLIGIATVNLQAGSGVLQTAAITGLIGLAVAVAAILGLPVYVTRLPFYNVDWIKPRLTAFVGALAVVRTIALFPALLLSLVIWSFECGAIAMIVAACDVPPGLFELSLIVGVSSLSTLLPSAPGYIGSLQVAYVLAFAALGRTAPQAVAAATLTQIVLLGSITLIGLGLLAAATLAKPRVAH
jgi:uncharacterized membrane protein YbhN (UPF0104 family)